MNTQDVWCSRATTCSGTHAYAAGSLRNRTLSPRVGVSGSDRLPAAAVARVPSKITSQSPRAQLDPDQGLFRDREVAFLLNGMEVSGRPHRRDEEESKKRPIRVLIRLVWPHPEPSGPRPRNDYLRTWQRIEFRPGNIRVAEAFNRRGMATSWKPPAQEEGDRRNVFDIKLLAQRLDQAVRWVVGEPDAGHLPMRALAREHGAAAALVAASALANRIGAVVSRGGRPDLAGDALAHVTAPTLLIVGGADFGVIELNRWALERLEKRKDDPNRSRRRFHLFSRTRCLAIRHRARH